MTLNPKVVRVIQQVPKKYHNTTFYIAIVVTVLLILQLMELFHGGK